MIRPKYLILALARARFWGEKPFWVVFLHLFKVLFGSKRRKGKKRKKKERRREFQEIQVRNISFCMELWYGTRVWKYSSKLG